MKRFLTTILAIALFIALATIGLTIAFIALGLFVIWWAYLYFTGRRVFNAFEASLREQMGEGQPSPIQPLDDGQTIEADYEVVDDEPKNDAEKA